MDKDMINELLLVCSTLGSHESYFENGVEKSRFIRDKDCLEWLQDLQRALRRDDDRLRTINLTLSSWKVFQNKLIPILISCRDDRPLVVVLLKICVMMTMPIAKELVQISRLAVPKIKDTMLPEVKHKISKRKDEKKSALDQIRMLVEYKEAFAASGQPASVLVGILERPLAATGARRQEMDDITIELVLTLMRNLLAVPTPSPEVLPGRKDAPNIHLRLVKALSDELMLDVFQVLAQNISARENEAWNFLLMEIFYHLVRDQDPKAVANCFDRQSAMQRAQLSSRGAQNPTSQEGQRNGSTHDHNGSMMSKSSSLASKLKQEKMTRLATTGGTIQSRHSRFGGTLKLISADGKNTSFLTTPFAKPGANLPQRNVRACETFSKRMFLDPVEQVPTASVILTQAQEALHSFSNSFMENCYSSLMNSLKDDFRRDSPKIQDGDNMVFFRLVAFYTAFYRICQTKKLKKRQAAESTRATPLFDLGPIANTIDKFVFSMMFRTIETACEHNKHQDMPAPLLLLKENYHILNLLNSSPNYVHQTLALSLLHEIHLSKEKQGQDQVPRLLKSFKPTCFTKQFVEDLIELVHLTLKVLEFNVAFDIQSLDAKKTSSDSATNGGTKGADWAILEGLRMKRRVAKHFDIHNYINNTLMSSTTVSLYLALFGYYAVNSPQINHYVVSFLQRVQSFQIPGMEVSAEPLLFNIQVLMIAEKILNDASLYNNPQFRNLLRFARSLVGNFATLAEKNRALFVESVLPVSKLASRTYCRNVQNIYAEDFMPKAENEEYFSGQDDPELARATVMSFQPAEQESDGEVEMDFGTAYTEQQAQRRRKKSKKRKAKNLDAEEMDKETETQTEWRKEEDSLLTKKYIQHSKNSQVLGILSNLPFMEKTGRTEQQIERRVRELGLKELVEKGLLGNGKDAYSNDDQESSSSSESELELITDGPGLPKAKSMHPEEDASETDKNKHDAQDENIDRSNLLSLTDDDADTEPEVMEPSKPAKQQLKSRGKRFRKTMKKKSSAENSDDDIEQMFGVYEQESPRNHQKPSEPVEMNSSKQSNKKLRRLALIEESESDVEF